MGRKTGKITFNVRDRGRTFNGKDRNYDLRLMRALIESGTVQERVKNRDMTGYYGHLIRMKFGMLPPESLVFEGKQVNIEPAIVTTHLSCDDDGNVTHEAQFLDTAPGAVAERLFNSRTGGFSSAIDGETTRAGVDIPTKFAGFDYVMEPNFTGNRGYMLDSASLALDGASAAFLDSIMAEQAIEQNAHRVLYDSLERDYRLQSETLARMAEENETLLGMLAADPSRSAAMARVMLDSTGGEAIRPMVIDASATRAFAARASSFKRSTLAQLEPQKEETPERPDIALEKARRAWGA